MSLTSKILAATLCAAFGLPALASSPKPLGVTTLPFDAIATPARSGETMQALGEKGYRLVTVDAWEDGYTRYPSRVAQNTLGVKLHPALAAQHKRDLLQETLIEAQRHGLTYIAWFGGGVQAADKDAGNPLRRMKPDWLARDAAGNELLSAGDAWINPLHPDARRYLLDLMLEAAESYDIDGAQIDPNLAWPPVALQDDAYTRSVYAAEHGGILPAGDDAAWRSWRDAKSAENMDYFMQALRAKRPRMVITSGRGSAPDFPERWRTRSQPLTPSAMSSGWGGNRWETKDLRAGRYRLIGFDGTTWDYLDDFRQVSDGTMWNKVYFFTSIRYRQVELVNDRRVEMRRAAK